MFTIDELVSIDKSALGKASKILHEEDLPALVKWPGEKDDDTRYKAFLLLQHRSVILIFKNSKMRRNGCG